MTVNELMRSYQIQSGDEIWIIDGNDYKHMYGKTEVVNCFGDRNVFKWYTDPIMVSSTGNDVCGTEITIALESIK